MSKVKSAIITTLLVIAMLVAAFFATISFPIGKTQRYNSMASSIHLGGDFSGYAHAKRYPEGVISAQDYSFLTEEEAKEYNQVNSVYVKNDADEAAIRESVAKDAKILSDRFAEKGYSSYSVTVEDGLVINIGVPTTYSYASYKNHHAANRSEDLSVASSALTTLTADGALSIRTSEHTITVGDDSTGKTYTYRSDSLTESALVDGAHTYPLTRVTEDVEDFFKSVSSRKVGATPVISIGLTQLGRERFKEITTQIAASESKAIYFFVGKNQMLQVSCSETFDNDKIELQATNAETAENLAIALNSCIKGNALNAEYETIGEVVESDATHGENAALLSFFACLAVLVIAAVLLILKYKKLGIVATLMAVLYSIIMIYALFLLEIELSLAGMIFAVLGLALLCASNAIVFEEVRKHTAVGKTMQASIKTAYRRTLMTVADIHIVLFVVSLLLTLVAVGEVAACGFIMLIATIASYILYWFTRLMWFVLSSPAKDKFGFGGYKRVVYDD